MRKIILIKLGGSLITQKDTPYTAKLDVINKIAAELKEIITVKKDTVFLLGNGGGSFAHYPAQKFNMKEGIKTKEQIFGYAAVQDGAAQLNRIVVDVLLAYSIAASSLHPSSFLTSYRGKKKELFTDSLFGLLKIGVVPVIYGDIVYDEMDGCHVFSTEDLFSLLIPALINNDYTIEKIIQLTTVAGVLNKDKNTIPSITSKNIETIKKHIYGTAGFDVTGGMLHKIEAALFYAQKGIVTYILQGNTNEKLLTKAVFDNKVRGTIISND